MENKETVDKDCTQRSLQLSSNLFRKSDWEPCLLLNLIWIKDKEGQVIVFNGLKRISYYEILWYSIQNGSIGTCKMMI